MTGPQTVEARNPHGELALLNKVAWNARWSSRTKSVTYARAVLDRVEPNPNPQLCVARGHALVTLAWQAKWRGEFDSALKFALEAETLLPECDHPDERGQAYSILGVIYYSRDRLDLATGATERGLKMVNPDLHCNAFVDLLTTQATIQRYNGNRSRAGLTLGRARDLAVGAELARVEHNVARWMLADGSAQKGIAHAKTSLQLCERFDNRVILPYAQEVLGACHVETGALDEAEAAFVAGLDLAITDEDFRAQCQIIRRYAHLEKVRNQLGRACDLNRYGAEIAARMTYPLWERDFAFALAEIYEDLGDLKQAIAAHKRAWEFEKERRT